MLDPFNFHGFYGRVFPELINNIGSWFVAVSFFLTTFYWYVMDSPIVANAVERMEVTTYWSKLGNRILNNVQRMRVPFLTIAAVGLLIVEGLALSRLLSPDYFTFSIVGVVSASLVVLIIAIIYAILGIKIIQATQLSGKKWHNIPTVCDLSNCHILTTIQDTHSGRCNRIFLDAMDSGRRSLRFANTKRVSSRILVYILSLLWSREIIESNANTVI